MSAIYTIDGKPHRLCDCSSDTPHCPRGRNRECVTAGYNKCFIPAPDAVMVVFDSAPMESRRE